MAETRRETPLAAWKAARETALLVDETPRGRLRLTGGNRIDFLHRITTNDIRGLAEGGVTPTLLVTPKGRLIERLTVWRRPDDLLILTAAGGCAAARDALARYIVVEDVAIHDESASTFQIALLGPRAGALLAAAADVEPDTLRPVRAELLSLAGAGVTAVPEPGPAWTLVGDAADGAAVRAALIEAGGGRGLVEADPAGHEAARIELGLPRRGHELSAEFNPLEARQEDALSFDKGCYIGQEVVARLRTYDKVQRRLVRLAVDGEDPVPAGSAIGEGPSAGVVTSAAVLAGEGRTAALGVVSREALDAGRTLTVHTDAGDRVARVVGDPLTARDLRVTAPQGPAPGRKRFGS